MKKQLKKCKKRKIETKTKSFYSYFLISFFLRQSLLLQSQPRHPAPPDLKIFIKRRIRKRIEIKTRTSTKIFSIKLPLKA